MKTVVFNSMLVRVGKKLTALRKSKGYTSHESFAHDHDLPRAQYWRLEKGKSNFTVKTLSRILEIHDLSMEEFFIDVFQKTTDKIEEEAD
jgi:transcriptional regulator with XRE-family HTH domain